MQILYGHRTHYCTKTLKQLQPKHPSLNLNLRALWTSVDLHVHTNICVSISHVTHYNHISNLQSSKVYTCILSLNAFNGSVHLPYYAWLHMNMSFKLVQPIFNHDIASSIGSHAGFLKCFMHERKMA